MILFRPVGLAELRLLYQAGMRAFPPRLPEQPIFYPVLNEPYARQIAEAWNTRSGTRAGFVTRFAVDEAYAARFAPHVVGSREHVELWVPAEELETFNAHLAGRVEVVGAYFGRPYVGEVARHGRLAGLDAGTQLVVLAAMAEDGSLDAAAVVANDHQAAFLNWFYWELEDADPSVGADQRDRVLDAVRQGWVASSHAVLPLGVVRG